MTQHQSRPVYARRNGFDPAPELLALREETPVRRIDVGPEGAGKQAWLITGYEEVRQAMSSPKFSSRRFNDPGQEEGGQGQPEQLVGNLMVYDPPDHTRLRKMLTPEFTVRRMSRLEPEIQDLAEEHLDEMEFAGPPADLMRRLAGPLAVAVMCELIGVPRDDHGEIGRLLHEHLTGQDRDRRAVTGTTLNTYLDDLIAERRGTPDEGFLGMLVREHGDAITDAELKGLCRLLLLAEFDNLCVTLGMGVLALLMNPDQLDLLRKDPGLVHRAVEEMLRYLSVTHVANPRIATEDVSIGGQLVAKGEMVICSLPAANRDPAFVADPDRLDLTREPAPHMSFGHGIHHCLGAPLARLYLRTAYLAVLQRFPALRLAVPPGDVPFRMQGTTYGVERLPVAW